MQAGAPSRYGPRSKCSRALVGAAKDRASRMRDKDLITELLALFTHYLQTNVMDKVEKVPRDKF